MKLFLRAGVSDGKHVCAHEFIICKKVLYNYGMCDLMAVILHVVPMGTHVKISYFAVLVQKIPSILTL